VSCEVPRRLHFARHAIAAHSSLTFLRLEQASYWRCLRNVLSPPPQLPEPHFNGLVPTLNGVSVGSGFGAIGGPARGPADQRGHGGPLSPRSPHGLEPRSPHSVERALRRNKLARVYRGKSSRRWAVMESLHLAVVKTYLKSQRRYRARHSHGSGGVWPLSARAAATHRQRSMTPEG